MTSWNGLKRFFAPLTSKKEEEAIVENSLHQLASIPPLFAEVPSFELLTTIAVHSREKKDAIITKFQGAVKGDDCSIDKQIKKNVSLEYVSDTVLKSKTEEDPDEEKHKLCWLIFRLGDFTFLPCAVLPMFEWINFVRSFKPDTGIPRRLYISPIIPTTDNTTTKTSFENQYVTNCKKLFTWDEKHVFVYIVPMYLEGSIILYIEIRDMRNDLSVKTISREIVHYTDVFTFQYDVKVDTPVSTLFINNGLITIEEYGQHFL